MANKILVVDDDLNICELLKLYLENDGYVVFTANDGQEAVEMFQNKTPDLVLLDIMLPKRTAGRFAVKSERPHLLRLLCSQQRAKPLTRCLAWSLAQTTML